MKIPVENRPSFDSIKTKLLPIYKYPKFFKNIDLQNDCGCNIECYENFFDEYQNLIFTSPNGFKIKSFSDRLVINITPGDLTDEMLNKMYFIAGKPKNLSNRSLFIANILGYGGVICSDLSISEINYLIKNLDEDSDWIGSLD